MTEQLGAEDSPASGRHGRVGKHTLTERLGAGEGLPSDLRAKFESSLGQDLSDVRVHRDAPEAAAISARAFTLGRDIVFSEGAYAPGDKAGQQLIAHEVAHVAQQREAAPANDAGMTQPGDSAEADADAAVTGLTQGLPVQVRPQPHAIARKTNAGPVARTSADEDAEHKAEGKTEGEEAVGELSAQRVGQEEDLESLAPEPPKHDTEGAKREIAAASQAQQPATASVAQDPSGPAAGASSPEAPAPGGTSAGSAAAPPPESGGGTGGLAEAQVHQAQQEAQEASAQAEARSTAYKAEVSERREKFEAEQHAQAIDHLKTMSPADKRSTLQDLGYDPKLVRKLKDAELDATIEGKLDTEQRKTKILGMEPDALAKLSSAQKTQFLCDLGIDRKDLEKAGPGKTDRLFDEILRQAHIPGTHKVKIQVKGGLLGKSWVVTVKCDADGATDIQAKKQGGFLSRLAGWIKTALPIVLTVLAPITGGATLIALSVYQTVMAIKSGNWLGVVTGVASAFAGIGALRSIAQGTSHLANALSHIASVATKVKKLADAAHAAMMAAKAKNAGSLLGALAQGATVFASFASNASGKFADTMTKWSERLKKWGQIASGGQRVVDGIRHHDAIAAIGGALDAAAAAAGPGTAGSALHRGSMITGLVNAGRRALTSNPPDYGAVAEAAFGIAAQVTGDRRVEDAGRITAAANRLKQAVNGRAANPAGVVEAALGLAEAIQVARYDVSHDETRDAGGKPVEDKDRTAIMERYQRSTRVVQLAGAALTAATAKPRPNYLAGLDAVTNLIAELTTDQRIDAAGALTTRLAAWTRAVSSHDERAAMEAGIALGEAINGMRDSIDAHREQAKQAAQQALPAGATLPDDHAPALPAPSGGDAHAQPPPAADDDAQSSPAAEEDAQPPPAPDATPAGDVSGDVSRPSEHGSPRASTPDANYTVIPGDTLSGIARRFEVTVDELRMRNPQLAGDRIYVGQRLIVPGAEHVLEGSVTTDETFRVDPKAAHDAQQTRRDQVARGAQVISQQMHAKCRAWNAEHTLGSDFYIYVRELDETVDALDRRIADPAASASDIEYLQRVVLDKHEGVVRLYGARQGQKTMFIDAGIEAATLIRDGAGITIDVLDRSGVISAGYQGVITAIDAYANGDPPQMVAARAAIAAAMEIIEVVPGANTVLKRFVNESFSSLGKAVGNYIADLTRDPHMSREQKLALARKYAQQVGEDLPAGLITAIGGQHMEHSEACHQLERSIHAALREAYDKAVEVALPVILP